jgi:hypothetical protein
LCNDKAVLGPWVNPRWLNYFTGAVIAGLVLLSIILTASVLFPDATNEPVILRILVGGGSVGLLITVTAVILGRRGEPATGVKLRAAIEGLRADWRMPPLEELAPAKFSLSAKLWMGVLRLYLVVAGGLVLMRIATLALGGGE